MTSPKRSFRSPKEEVFSESEEELEEFLYDSGEEPLKSTKTPIPRTLKREV